MFRFSKKFLDYRASSTNWNISFCLLIILIIPFIAASCSEKKPGAAKKHPHNSTTATMISARSAKIAPSFEPVIGVDGFSRKPAITPHGNLLFCSDDGSVVVVDPIAGSIVSTCYTGLDLNGVPAILDNALFIGGTDGWLRALNPLSGAILWKFKTDGKIAGSCLLLPRSDAVSENRVVFGSYDFKIYCLDAAAGSLRWSVETNNFVNSSPTLAKDVICVGGCDGKLRFISKDDGNVLGSLNMGSYIPSTPAVTGSSCVTTLYNGEIVKVDLASRSVVWRWKAAGRNTLTFTNSPVILGQRVTAVSESGDCVALWLDTGKKIWSAKLGEKVSALPLPMGDLIVIADIDGAVHLLNAGDGEEIAVFAVGEPISADPVVIGKSAFVLATEKGSITALRIEQAQTRKPRVSRLWNLRPRFAPRETRKARRAEP